MAVRPDEWAHTESTSRFAAQRRGLTERPQWWCKFFHVSNEVQWPSGRRSRHGRLLALLRDEGASTRIELARRMSSSPTTVSRIVAQLIDGGFVAEGARVTRAGVGRRGTEVDIAVDSHWVVGVQIGVGRVRVGVANLVGRCLALSGFSFDPGARATDVVARAARTLLALIVGARVRRDRVVAVGVAVPGPVDDARRRLLMQINLAWEDVAVADVLERLVGLPVVVEHNVRSMALAEAVFGAARGVGSVGFIHLRTGIGAGLVVAGRGFLGGVHGAIELGHIRVTEGGRRCSCGAVGCLETELSDRGLRRSLRQVGARCDGREPLAALLRAARADRGAAIVLDTLIGKLAAALSMVVNLLTPEIILLGGSLELLPDGLIDRLSRNTREGVFPVIRPSVRLQRSSLGPDAGVKGAATAALDRFVYA
ncbi:ROK family transcriptional regulator [Jiangella ureilytica]|uniref:ROK family transcriptional regulator n=1 Tax=Jiangella ureilytica TaxID=2530374 RepID=A0A4R4RPG3_9ACTN|nr:ROK family transcriptional regulator [Jiangella ureilytica]TDC50363.1 ROK family transcriptional regulator [Jiangella ureilytica]